MNKLKKLGEFLFSEKNYFITKRTKDIVDEILLTIQNKFSLKKNIENTKKYKFKKSSKSFTDEKSKNELKILVIYVKKYFIILMIFFKRNNFQIEV